MIGVTTRPFHSFPDFKCLSTGKGRLRAERGYNMVKDSSAVSTLRLHVSLLKITSAAGNADRLAQILQGVRSAQAAALNKHFNYVNATEIRKAGRCAWHSRSASRCSAGGNGETFSTFYATLGTATSEGLPGLWWWARRRMERRLTLWTIILWQAWILSSTLNAIISFHIYLHGFLQDYT